MPKIVIKEIDKTKAGLGEYSNFTVFVPGFVSSNKIKPTTGTIDRTKTYFDDIADENGVAELSDQADFIKYVGKVAQTVEPIAAKAPVLAKLTPDASEAAARYAARTVSASEFYITYRGQLYTLDTSETPSQNGHLKAASNIVVRDGETDIEITGTVGVYNFADPDKANTWDANTEYFRILPGDEGTDYVEVNPQVGNQIAYELLGIGYKVLFKQITQNEIDGLGDDDMKDDSFWAPFADKATYDFRYLISGFMQTDNTAATTYTSIHNAICKLATERGDCVALIDIPEYCYNTAATDYKVEVAKYTAGISASDKYTAFFMPTVEYNMTEDSVYNNSKFPGYFHYLLCASDAFVNYPEWFAVAGYTRGVSHVYSVKATTKKLGDAAVNLFEPRTKVKVGKDGNDDLFITKAINIISTIKGAHYLWGNRTAFLLGDADDPVNDDLVASHFLNIRQLCTTIKKELYVTCRRFTFDPNSDILWINFCNAISPLLDRMKANQGIEDYKIVKVPVDTKGLLKAKIRIVPIEAVEDFELELFLEDSITGTSVEIDESNGTN